MENQEEMVVLKARLFDAEEAAKLAQHNFNQLVAYLMEQFNIEAETLQEFVDKLKAAVEVEKEEVVSE